MDQVGIIQLREQDPPSPRPSPPGRGGTAVELRSADFSPPPSGLAKSAGSGLKSALQVPRNSLNSTAVHPGPRPQETENQPQFRDRSTTSGSTRPNEAAAFSDGKSDEANEP